MNVPVHQQPNSYKDKPNTFLYNAFQKVPNGILIVNSDMNIIFANNYMYQYLSISPYSIDGPASDNPFPCLLSKNTGFQCKQRQCCKNCAIQNSLNRIFSEGADVEGITFSQTYFNNGKETSRWFLISGNPLFFDNEVYGILSFADITFYKHKELRLLEKLELDLSTNTLNKHSLLKYINQLVSTANKKHFTLCMMDFDCFKEINDQHGHLMGDEVLKTFSCISQNNIRTNDIIGRYGGEEFIFAFPDTSLEEAVKIIIRIQKEVKDHFSSILTYPVSFSAGMIHVNIKANKSLKCTELINRVDRLLYKAKEHGKNRLVTANKEYQFL